jgi:hypothetical protein
MGKLQLVRATKKSFGVITKKQQCMPVAPSWPTYIGESTYIGSSNSGRIHVFVDASLGTQANQNGIDLVNDSDRVVALNDSFFGTNEGEVSVMIYAMNGLTDGTGGADHATCNYETGNAIEVCASFGSPLRVAGLLEAELSECNMGGNLCGVSTGEALSRWCANIVSNNALSDFATAPTWFQDGMPNFVDNIAQTDQDADSIGCGMAFISWLKYQGYEFPAIAQGMVTLGEGGLFCQLYQQLTGSNGALAWDKFQKDIQNLPYGVIIDDPFNG